MRNSSERRRTDHLSGYCWIGSSRRNISANALRGSGGIGFLMKEKLLENFHAHISENNCDDILWIQLTSKYDSEHILYFCVCYLQPERSSRGNLAQDFYDSLLSQMYLYSNGNPIFICGDFNGRVGSLKDFDDMVDCIPERKIVDEIKKYFGEHLINFLKDKKCCMLNGRGENVKNNFTYVSNLRKSVVDYMIVPYNELAQYRNIEIKLISDIILQNNIPLTPSISIPDHSVLMCSFQLSSYCKIIKQQSQDNARSDATKNRKYKVSYIPQDIFTSERRTRALEGVIDSLLRLKGANKEVNSIYETLIKLYTSH